MQRCKRRGKHQLTAGELLGKLFYFDPIHGDRPRTYATIQYISEFEKFGAYEDMGYGWRVGFHGFNEGIVSEHVCLECAIEQVMDKLCRTEWHGWTDPTGETRPDGDPIKRTPS